MAISACLGMALISALVASAPALGDEPKFPDPPHSILFLGTFHFADPGLDDFKPEVDINIMDPKRQRELEGVLAMLEGFKPTKIAVEVKADKQSEVDAQYAAYLNGRLELTTNEVHQIGFRLAKQLGHKRVYAIDAPGRWYEPYINPEGYAREHGQEAHVNSPWYSLYERAWRAEDELLTKMTLGEYLLQLNDPKRVLMSHGVYLVGTFKVGDPQAYVGADVKTAWFNRNLRIFSNITRITTEPNERILVIIGSGHLPILQHCAEASPEYRLVQAASLVAAPAASSQTSVDAEKAVRANAHRLVLENGALSGPGAELILSEAKGAQFVMLGEPHNTDQVNALASALFKALHEASGPGRRSDLRKLLGRTGEGQRPGRAGDFDSACEQARPALVDHGLSGVRAAYPCRGSGCLGCGGSETVARPRAGGAHPSDARGTRNGLWLRPAASHRWHGPRQGHLEAKD